MASDLSPLTPSGHDDGIADPVELELDLDPSPSRRAGDPSPSTRIEADRAHSAPGTQPGPAPIHGWFRRYRMNLLMVGLDVVAALLTLRFSGVSLVLAASAALLLVMLNCCSGLNRSRFTLSALDDAPALVGRGLAVSMAVLVVSSFYVDDPTPSTVGVLALPLVVLLLRSLGYEAVRSARRHGRHQHRALVLGAGVVGRDLAQAMLDKPELGLVPVGFVDASPLGGPTGLPVPVVGSPADLADAITSTEADHVVIAFTATREIELVDDDPHLRPSALPRSPSSRGCSSWSPRSTHTDELQGMPLVRLHRAPFRTLSWPLKRAMDVALSATAILLLRPVLLVIAALVRIVDGPGGILFRQERVGVDDRPSSCSSSAASAGRRARVATPPWNIKNDDRMSWLGRDPAQDLARRAAAAVQHPARRHVPGRASARAAALRRHVRRARCCATATGTGCPPGSPAGRRSTGCAATPRSRSAPGSTTTTSRTGRSGSTSRSSCARSPT